MFEKLEVLRMAGAMSANAAQRQDAVARNIANADTPGYKAVDAPDFAASYQDGDGFTLRTTLPGHIGGSGSMADPTQIVPRLHPDTQSPDGNTVSLESELARAAQLKQQNDMALTIYRSALTILRTSLDKQG